MISLACSILLCSTAICSPASLVSSSSSWSILTSKVESRDRDLVEGKCLEWQDALYSGPQGLIRALWLFRSLLCCRLDKSLEASLIYVQRINMEILDSNFSI